MLRDPTVDLAVLDAIIDRLGRIAESPTERVQHLMALGRLRDAQAPAVSGPGAIATWENWRLEVIALDGKRTDKVLASRLPEPADDIGAEQEAGTEDRSESA